MNLCFFLVPTTFNVCKYSALDRAIRYSDPSLRGALVHWGGSTRWVGWGQTFGFYGWKFHLVEETNKWKERNYMSCFWKFGVRMLVSWRKKSTCANVRCVIGSLSFFERLVVAFKSKPDLLLFQGVFPPSIIADLLGAFERKKRRRKKKRRKTGTPTWTSTMRRREGKKIQPGSLMTEGDFEEDSNGRFVKLP